MAAPAEESAAPPRRGRGRIRAFVSTMNGHSFWERSHGLARCKLTGTTQAHNGSWRRIFAVRIEPDTLSYRPLRNPVRPRADRAPLTCADHRPGTRGRLRASPPPRTPECAKVSVFAPSGKYSEPCPARPADAHRTGWRDPVHEGPGDMAGAAPPTGTAPPPPRAAARPDRRLRAPTSGRSGAGPRTLSAPTGTASPVGPGPSGAPSWVSPRNRSCTAGRWSPRRRPGRAQPP